MLFSKNILKKQSSLPLQRLLTIKYYTFQINRFSLSSFVKNQNNEENESLYSREHISGIVEQEVKNYIDQRNRELRFAPNELDLNTLLGKESQDKETLVKLFGDYTSSQDTSYWTGLNEDVRFSRLHIIKPELEIILYNIFKNLELEMKEAKRIRDEEGFTEDISIGDLIQYTLFALKKK